MFKLKSSDYSGHNKKVVSKSAFTQNSKTSSGGVGGEDPKDLLKCPVCLEQYTDESGRRVPLFLSCHHTVCRACLPKLSRPHIRHSHAKDHKEHKENGSEVSCPQCRMVTLVPPGGLSQNFYIMQVLFKQKRRTSGEEGALRMWCRDCESIALEGCSSHEVTHLTGVLKQLADSCLHTRKNLITILKARSQKQGESAHRLREAVDQVDRASASLRRRLVTYLDRATLAHATASSLLQEVETMCEQVELESFVQDKVRSTLSTSPSAPDMLESYKRSHSHTSANNSPDIGNRHSSLYPDVRDLTSASSNELTRNAIFEPTIEASLGEERIQFVDGSSQFSNTNALISSLETCSSALRELSCAEQEVCIVDLRECLTVMTRMQASLRDDQHTALPKPVNTEDGISTEKLIEMFKNSIQVLENNKKSV